MVSKTHNAGFTLFELIIVVGIIVMVFGAALAGYNAFNRRERLKQAALTLKANLRFAQTKALSSEKPSSGCTTFVGMRVTFTVTSYSIQHFCSEGGVGTGQTTNLPTGIQFTPQPIDFTYLAITQATSLSASQTMSLTNGSQTYRLTISTSGALTDNGFQ